MRLAVHSKIIWRPTQTMPAAQAQVGRVQVDGEEVLIEIKPYRRNSLSAEANGRPIAFARSMSGCKSRVEDIVKHSPERLFPPSSRRPA